MSSTKSSARIGSRLAGIALIVVLVASAAGCSSSSKTSATTSPTVKSAPVNTQTPFITTLSYPPQNGNPAPAAAFAAISAFEKAHGPALGTWLLTSVQASKADPSFVMYRISPASTKDTNVQNGYGFAHLVGSKWNVVAFGSDAVGCPPGSAGNATIPPTVLSSFGLSC